MKLMINQYVSSRSPNLKAIIVFFSLLYSLFVSQLYAGTCKTVTIIDPQIPYVSPIPASRDLKTIYSAPNTDSPSIGIIHIGETYVEISSSASGWRYIHYGYRGGWVPPAMVQDGQSANCYKVKVSEGNLNVRTGRGSSYNDVGDARNSSKWIVSSTKNGWAKITFEGSKERFVSANYLVGAGVQPNPTVSSFRLNNGASETTSRRVKLNFNKTGKPVEYRVSERGDFDGTTWKTYKKPIHFVLSNRFGKHTVHFQIKDAKNRTSTKRKDAIYYVKANPNNCLGDVECLPLPPEAEKCWQSLDCSVDTILSYDLKKRTRWFESSVLRYGPSQGFADRVNGQWKDNWFANIFGVLQLVEEYESTKKLGSAAFHVTDAYILAAVQNGLKLHLTGTQINKPWGGYPPGDWWAMFFKESAKANPRYTTLRRRWGVAEQIATNQGRTIVYFDFNIQFTLEELKLLIWVGDFYRFFVANNEKLTVKAIENLASFDPRKPDDLVKFGRLMMHDYNKMPNNIITRQRYYENKILGPIVEQGMNLAALSQTGDWVCQDSTVKKIIYNGVKRQDNSGFLMICYPAPPTTSFW